MFAETLLDLCYKPSRADMDICMKTDTKPQTEKGYFAYVIVYVDDFLSIHNYP